MLEDHFEDQQEWDDTGNARGNRHVRQLAGWARINQEASPRNEASETLRFEQIGH